MKKVLFYFCSLNIENDLISLYCKGILFNTSIRLLANVCLL